MLLTTTSKVILLEVAQCFVEAVPVSNALKCTLMVQSQDCTPVEQIMHHVAGIKELSNSSIYGADHLVTTTYVQWPIWPGVIRGGGLKGDQQGSTLAPNKLGQQSQLNES